MLCNLVEAWHFNDDFPARLEHAEPFIESLRGFTSVQMLQDMNGPNFIGKVRGEWERVRVALHILLPMTVAVHKAWTILIPSTYLNTSRCHQRPPVLAPICSQLPQVKTSGYRPALP